MSSDTLISLLLPAALLFAAAVTAVGQAPAPPETHVSPAAAAIPTSVDIRPNFLKLGLENRRQGGRGTCSVFAVTGALEYAVAREQGHGTRLSIEFLNWAAHQAVGRREDGGFFSDLWKGYEKYGICPDADLPYASSFDPDLQPGTAVTETARRALDSALKLHWIKEWDVKTGVTDSELAAIKSALRNEWPVCGGFRWPKRAAFHHDILQMCAPEEVFDGHSVILVGYRDDSTQPGGGLFIIRNSGSGKDEFLPYAYIQAYMNDAIWIESPVAVKQP